MSVPSSVLWEVQQIAGAGRGVIARQAIAQGEVVHESGRPCVHVIFKQYSKETCAQCFHWDRGRALPVRETALGKVFCSTHCRHAWMQQHDDVGIEAWRTLTAFVRSGGGGGGGKADALMADGDRDGDGSATRPGADAIAAWWQMASEDAEMLLRSKQETGLSKQDRRTVQAIVRKMAGAKDHEKLSYFLCGALFDRAARGDRRNGILNLAMDDAPYTTQQDLEDSCNAFLQLISIMPLSLTPHLSPELCLNLVRADNHNAFGIRGGGEDSEEYMGYGVYPSASYFNHSCDANTHKKRVGGSWTFYAAKDIQPGDELCITYLGGDEKDLDLAGRRCRLQDVWGFVCCCVRCKTESDS